ncbi:MAG: uridylate kinase, partial [Clostridia bacterium]|nr:uridylate kinase [Clostridia bacterium]
KPGRIWISSGAAEIGRIDYVRRTGRQLDNDDQLNKVDYAAQGQAILMQEYRKYINPLYGVRQVLVEHQHYNNPAKRELLKSLLLRCPAQGVVPIINYNDPLSNDEIVKLEIRALTQSGMAESEVVHCVDNDETASQTACLLKCRRLIIFTSTLGIYSSAGDPSTLISEISGKDVYEVIDNITACQSACIGSSRKGAGGAKAKLEYIKAPVMNGTEVFIASPQFRIEDVISGKVKCTRIGVR